MLIAGGCRMDNPAYGDDDVAGSESAGESTSAAEVGETGSTSVGTSEGTSDATSNDATSSSEGTTDGSEADVDTSDAIELDMMEAPICEADFTEPYSVIYGVPAAFDGDMCPALVAGHYAKVTGEGPDAGLVMVQRCTSELCNSCSGSSYPLGVVGLDDFSTPLVEWAANGTVCLKLQTGPSYGLDADRCGYSTLWVGEVFEGIDLLVAQHAVAQLPASGVAALGGLPPALGITVDSCECEGLFGPGDPNLECCQASMVAPSTATLVFAGIEVAAGEFLQVVLGQVPWTFSVAQAQHVPTCDNQGAPGVSWALTRDF